MRGSLEVIEKAERAHERAGVDRIVITQSFSDSYNAVPACLHLHCIVQIKNGIYFPIDRDIELSKGRFAQEKLDDRWVEQMVAHRQKKRRRHV